MKLNKMRKISFLSLLFLIVIGVQTARAEGQRSYWENIPYNYARGFKNLVSAPAEIVLGIKNYPDSGEAGLIRGSRGLVDGSFKAVNRFVSGGWDLIAAFIPGYQEGIPPTPEALF